MSLFIKICANTSLEDARLGADAGANAVGFVFAPSPRRVTVGQVASITPHLPPALEKIGVFVDATLDEIAATVNACGLTGVQLHFDAAPELPAQLRQRFGSALRILRVLYFNALQPAEELNPAQALKGVVSGHDLSRAEKAVKTTWALAPEDCFSDSNVDAVLIDSRTATSAGGTGLPFDWTLASRTLFQTAEARRHRLIAAGGLNPANVAEAIAALRPWGVDVASGVETSPGRKDPAKVREFVANARAAFR
jgi:phosphoribosylanthranilate isomerase